MIVPDGSFDLEEDGDYTVVITAKFPTAGTLQINMGSWSANDQATFPVGASDEFQTIECDFAEWSVSAEGAHLLFDCGDFKGTTIVKKIKIIKGIQKPFNPAYIRYNFITKGKVAEVISNPNKKYRGIVEIPATVTHEGETYTVTKIGDNAFYGCSGLTSITIPNSVTSIGNNVFSDCSSLESISIGSGMKSIGSGAFANCPKLTDVYCLAEKLGGNEGLNTETNAFDGSYIEYDALHVPAASLNSYMNTDPWKKFQSKVAISNGEIPETPKCAKPEISFVNGKVSFSCATEGVEYISEVTLADTHKYYDSEILLSQKYKVSVYATKTNYINSDVTTREIIITGNGKAIVVGDVDGDGKVNVADHVKLSDIIMEK